MELEDIQKQFREAGILNKKNGRKFCYKQILENNSELSLLWQNFYQSYRSEEEAWFSISHLSEPPKCPICGNLCAFTGITKHGGNGYKTTCGKCSANAVPSKVDKFKQACSKKTNEQWKASFEKRKATCKEKYGDENATLFGSTSFKKTLKEKYGDEHFNNREKAKQTCLERFGVECNIQTEDFQKKALETKKQRYGNASNYEKTKQTNLKKYGVEHIGQRLETQQKSAATKQQKCKDFEESFNCRSVTSLKKQYGTGWYEAHIIDSYLINNNQKFVSLDDVQKIEAYWKEGHCHTNGYVSKKEKELLEYIKSIYDGPIIENDTSSVPNLNHRYYELDIFLPKLNIAFDFDGNYYHSSKFKDRYYHQRKTLCCYKQGIKLAHILEQYWDDNLDQIKNKIKQLIFENKSFNDGFFPNFDAYDKIKLSEPREIHLKGDFVYYDTGVIANEE